MTTKQLEEVIGKRPVQSDYTKFTVDLLNVKHYYRAAAQWEKKAREHETARYKTVSSFCLHIINQSREPMASQWKLELEKLESKT